MHAQLRDGARLLEQTDQLVQHDPARPLRITPVQPRQQLRHPSGGGGGTGEVVQQVRVHPSSAARTGGDVQAVQDT